MVSAVHDLSLTVKRHNIVAILGANGAGKSSTLNAICGNLRATVTGTVALLGDQIRGLSPHAIVRRGMVLVPEGRDIIAPLTVEENLLLAGYGGRARRRSSTFLVEVYELFPILRERRRTFGGLLSGGEQQMLALGRAIMSDPKIIVMDEPSMGLSPAMVKFVMKSIKRINQRGLTVLLVEQNAHAALQIADYAFVLERGRLVKQGSASELRSDARIEETFLGLKETSAKEGSTYAIKSNVTSTAS